MKEQNNYLYEFESFRIDPLRRKLFCNGQDLQVKPRAFDTLLFLVRRSGEVVSKDELIGAVWADTNVEENNLLQQVSTLRKKFGEYGNKDEFIITMPKQGYKFVQPVKVIGTDQENAFSVEIVKYDPTVSSGERALDNSHKLSLPRTIFKFLFYSQMREITLGCLLMMLVILFSFYVEAHKNISRLPMIAKSIVILDFEPLDKDEKSSFYSAGITHTLTAKIGNMESMVLRPSGSSGKFYGQERDVISIGKELNADVVLEGSVQNDGRLVRIAVVAWDSKTKSKIWGDVFTRDGSNAFDIQDEVSKEIISAVQTKLLN